MKRPTSAIGKVRTVLILTVLCVLAILFARAALWRPLDLHGAPPTDGLIHISGVVHVHTVHSDGGGTVGDVIKAGQLSDLDFVIITDHNNLDAKPMEGYHGSVIVLVGTEISTTAGYVLGLGIPDPVFRFSGGAEDALEDVRDLGGVSFAASIESRSSSPAGMHRGSYPIRSISSTLPRPQSGRIERLRL